MDRIKELQKASGTGLKHSGRIGSLITPPSGANLSDSQLLSRVTVEFVECGSFHVMLDSSQKRAATLKCGELVPYSLDDINLYKATEFSNGRCVHVFRGFHKRGTTIREGPGSFHYGGGEVFEGRWRNNMRHGLGALYLPSGYSYEGHFKDDEPCGRGVETFPSGEKYVGEFAAGKPHGYGVMYYVDNGSRYEGQWEEGEKHGAGVLFYGNGDIFEGTWDKGKRNGVGVSTVFAQRCPQADANVEKEGQQQQQQQVISKSYQSTWDKDKCSMKMKLLDSHVPQRSNAPPIESVYSPLGADLRTFRVVPELWLTVHPAHFHRIRNAFELFDTECTGEIEMDALRDNWDPSNIETLHILERAATTVGDDNTLELIEVLTGLYPHLPVTELRRWVLTDLTLEYLLRLRGVLATVPAPKQDGFYAVSQGKKVMTKQDVEINKGVVGGVRVTHSMFVRNKILRQGDGIMTFPQMLSEVFPNLWPESTLRVEVEDIPLYALEGYLSSFREYDEAQHGFLPLEKMKIAQRRYQNARSHGNTSISMPTNVWEEKVTQGFMKHQARWLMGDISLTVGFVKQVDRGRTGYFSFAEILRNAFPNVPCLATKERLGGLKAEDQQAVAALGSSGGSVTGCGCCICSYCNNSEFDRVRPASPYLDGGFTW